jgi:hypothetical protein
VLGLNENPEFEGLTPEDFDAFAPEKWNSNMFTLPRRKVKSKLAHLGRLIEQQLKQQSLPLIMHLSDEFPSLWNRKIVDNLHLFFSRDEEAQAALTAVIDKERTLATTLADPTPRYRQIFLGAAVNETHLEVGLRLHHDAWVDRDNLLRKLDKPENKDEFVGFLKQLPPFYLAGFVEDSLLFSPSDITRDNLAALCVRFAAERTWFFIGARLPKDQVCVLGRDIAPSVLEVLSAIIPFYKYLAWSPNNDAISLASIAAQREEEIQRSHEQLDREKAQRAAERLSREQAAQKLRGEIEDRVREQETWRNREIALRRAAMVRAAEEEKRSEARIHAENMAAKWSLPKSEAKPDDTANPCQLPTAEPAPLEPRAQPKAAPTSHLSPDNTSPGVGDVVEVCRGFLKGRRGVLQELDDKGGARVNFGAMSSRLDLEVLRRVDPSHSERTNIDNQAAHPAKHATVTEQKRGGTLADPRGPTKPRGAGFSEG